MALNLYRRHGSHCSGGRSLFTRTYEADELRRGCTARVLSAEHSTGVTPSRSIWSEAKGLATVWETARTWTALVVAPPVLPTEPTEMVLVEGQVAQMSIPQLHLVSTVPHEVFILFVPTEPDCVA